MITAEAAALLRALRGDPSSFSLLEQLEQDDLQHAARELEQPIMLSAQAVCTVLLGLQQGTIAPDLAQRWASFMSRGFIASSPGPWTPLDIDWAAERELQIAEALRRLDDIGDLIDGHVSTEEIDELVRRLQNP